MSRALFFYPHDAVYRVAWDGKKFRRKSLEDVSCPEGCMKW
jgi:hypothetical protein